MKNKIVSVLLTLLFFFCAGISGAGETKILTLEESINITLSNNPNILSSQQKLLSGKWKVAETSGGFYPQISASGSYSRLSEVSAFEIPAGTFGPGTPAASFSSGQPDVWTIKASAQQYLFTWFRALNTYKQSKANFEAAKLDCEKTKAQTVLDVTKGFYGIILANELVKVSEEAIKNAEIHLENAQRNFKAGVSSEFDVLKAEVQLSNLKPQLIKVRNNLKLAKNSFRNLLKIDDNTPFELQGELKYNPLEYELKEGINKAILSRVELKQINYQKVVADLAVKIADSGNKPNLSFSYYYQWQKGQSSDPEEWEKSWTAGANLSIPIFDGFITRARVKQAKAALEDLKIAESSFIQNIKLEVEQAYYELKENEEIIISQEKNIQQAKKALELVEARYREGMATNAEVMDTQLVLLQTRLNMLQALYDYNIAQTKWKKAVGEL